MGLHEKHCAPCSGDTPKLTASEIEELLVRVVGWTLADERLSRSFLFSDFAHAIEFVNAMAAVAESEAHHPDFCVHWNRVDVTIWTHAIGGLSENDFILAARIGRLRD